MIWKTIIILSIALIAFSDASAAPVGVTYSVSGSAGNWTIDFTVANNEAGTDQAIYLFGVLLSGPGVTGSPSPYHATTFPTWTNSGLGGSNLVYNNVWEDASAANLLPGETLSGFDVHVSDAKLPGAVPWFTLSTGTIPYTGAGSFGDSYNPGFEGMITPEPATWLLGGCGFMALLMKYFGKYLKECSKVSVSAIRCLSTRWGTRRACCYSDC